MQIFDKIYKKKCQFRSFHSIFFSSLLICHLLNAVPPLIRVRNQYLYAFEGGSVSLECEVGWKYVLFHFFSFNIWFLFVIYFQNEFSHLIYPYPYPYGMDGCLRKMTFNARISNDEGFSTYIYQKTIKRIKLWKSSYSMFICWCSCLMLDAIIFCDRILNNGRQFVLGPMQPISNDFAQCYLVCNGWRKLEFDRD